jgi:hypothetical protein
MAVLSTRYGYLFLMAPRTGCSATAKGALVPHGGGELFPAADFPLPKGAMGDAKHATLDDLIRGGQLTREQADRLLIFTTVRNPFDSMVTLYVTMRRRYARHLEDPPPFMQRDERFLAQTRAALDLDFPTWLARSIGTGSWRHPWSKLVHRAPAPHHMYAGYIKNADVIMRYESLQADFDRVLERLGLDPIEIPRMNVSRRGEETDYRPYYTPTARALVARVYRPDLDRFGYTF